MLIGSTIYDLHRLLRESNSLIVHFSGTPKGVGTTFLFPNDLQSAISNTSFSLSCSVIQPGDYLGDDPLKPRRATGTVGIILDLQAPESLMAVCPKDAGTPLARSDRNLRLDECTDSITGRETTPGTAYNEWNIKNYIVRGIFAAVPLQVSAIKKIDDIPGGDDLPDYMKGESTTDVTPITLRDIRSFFPEQRIYTFENGQIAEAHPRGGFVQTSHVEIYR